MSFKTLECWGEIIEVVRDCIHRSSLSPRLWLVKIQLVVLLFLAIQGLLELVVSFAIDMGSSKFPCFAAVGLGVGELIEMAVHRYI